jgi:hypothetical protein
MNTHQIKLMLQAAVARLADADLLGTKLNKQSDADYLLRLLAFEILLKATLHMHSISFQRNHSYRDLFQKLPTEIRDSIIAMASERISTSGDYSRLDDLLITFTRNFICLRYPYEAYAELTEEEYRRKGDVWLMRGAPLNEATFTYYPNELYGLIYAFSTMVENWLANQSSQPTSFCANVEFKP